VAGHFGSLSECGTVIPVSKHLYDDTFKIEVSQRYEQVSWS